MPSPFPGMDPYLEDPEYWRGVHHGLIGYAAEILNAKMPPGYVARIDERVYVAPLGRSIYPDVSVVRRSKASPQKIRTHSSTALAEREDPPQILSVSPTEMNEGFIEVRTVKPPKRIITVIEILSPSNKTLGSAGRQKYVEKQSEVLKSEMHLLEIDLLRRGAHTIAAPEESLREEFDWDYIVCLSRSSQRNVYEIWPNSVRERLPRIRVPLTDDKADLVLDLQAVFDRCYDAGLYWEDVIYTQEPIPSLSAEDAAWADALLREKGLRK